MAHKDNWLLYRSLGSYDENGNWQPPLSFTEAQSLPRPMLRVFFELDDWLQRMQNQRRKDL